MEPDNFPLTTASKLTSEHALITGYLTDMVCLVEQRKTESYGRAEAQILACEGEQLRRMILALRERLEFLDPIVHACAAKHGYTAKWHSSASLPDDLDRLHFLRARCEHLLHESLKKRPAFAADFALELISWLMERDGGLVLSAQPFLGWIGSLAEGLPPGTPIPHNIRQTAENFRAGQPISSFSTLQKLESTLGLPPMLPLEAGEPWADLALADLTNRPSRAVWASLFTHCLAAKGGVANAKWTEKAAKFWEEAGLFEEFRTAIERWFPLVDRPRRLASGTGYYGLPVGSLLISEPHMDLLHGLAWMCGLREDRALARSLSILAISAYRKVPGKGPRAVRVGNACVTALGMMPGLDAVGQLALLKAKVKFGTAQKMIDKALTAAAEREGLPREELEEMAVPAYGLTEVGRLVEMLGEFTAELEVTGSKSAGITWRRADGKVQKSLPAAVKKEFAEELKELNAAKKDIENMLPAQAERIDALFLQQKSWPVETWLERYLDHPLIGTLARRLIWNFTTDGTTTPGLWLDGKLVDRLGHPVPLEPARSTVALWHPLDQPPDVVLGWRGFLEEWQIVQPFKQAHREVYLLTPAEERTRTYSNRFAAHILKQHQFHALAAARGWKNKLRLMVDADYPPATRLLPQWGLRAEFWIEGAGDQYGTDTNETGTYLYLATDQVRFYRIDDAQVTAHAGGGGYGPGWQRPIAVEPLPLAEIPPLVFSEIMRDVDLFVGVASVGNDPAWADGGRRDAERAAWNLHAFGDLSATAQTRRELLQRLVPKLKIADRCSFAEKFLVVRGDLRTYKIHLGSGNILMSPNDCYLCIVPGAGKAEEGKVFLPFEGDRTLSVILSKAFLLAADAKITDPSITGQIGLR